MQRRRPDSDHASTHVTTSGQECIHPPGERLRLSPSACETRHVFAGGPSAGRLQQVRRCEGARVRGCEVRRCKGYEGAKATKVRRCDGARVGRASRSRPGIASQLQRSVGSAAIGNARPRYRSIVPMTTSAIMSMNCGSSLTASARAKASPVSLATSAASRSRSYNTSM